MHVTTRSLRLALLASASLCPVASIAADTTIASGTTDNGQKSVGGTDTLTVESGGALSVNDTAIKWNSPSTDLRITNSGTIESIADDGRALNAGGSSTAPRTLTLINNAGGIIRAQNDAIRINTDITGGTVKLTNAGTILSSVDGQALDFDAVESTADGQIEIDNLAGGIIQSTDADAIRPGQGTLVVNAGTIYAGKVDGLKNDGIDLQAHSATIHNLTGGLISGARHGITTDNDVSIVNEAGATIIGRNGSGVGSDGSATVINYGTITGAYDGSGNGDGDGIDIDHVGYVENYGTINALGSAGTHDDGRPNGSDGVTFGTGGTFINHAGALVYSVTTGVAFGVQATVINEGTIHSGNGNALATDTGNDIIVNSGTVISDSASAISTGPGDDHLTLLPGSSISGGVDGGTGDDLLTLGGDSDGMGSGTFAGATGFERLAVDAGSWTLTGASQFADGTAIAAGASLTGAAETLTGAIDNAGTLTVDQPTDGVFAATLAGAGAFIKTGAGTLTLGSQPYTGPTQVAAGTLQLTGTLASAVSVADGATLRGPGTIGALSIASGGTVAPGAGVLSVTGDLLQQTGSTFVADLAGDGTSSGIAVGGTATIEPGALISLSQGAGAGRIGTRYTLVAAAGGVSGIYTAEQSANAGTELRLGSTANTIFGIVARTGGSLSTLALTPNQAAVAPSFAALGVGNPAYAALTLEPSDDAARAGLSQLAGEVHASVHTAMNQEARLADDAARGRLDDIAGGRPGLWGQFVAGHGDDDGAGGAADARRNTLGGLGGADIAIGENARAGLAGGYTRTRLRINDRASRARIGATHLLGYVGAESGPWRVRGVIGYAWDRVRTRRSVAFAGFSDLDQARYHGHVVHGSGELAYAIAWRGGTIAPFARGTFVHVRTDSFAESGGAAALDGGGRSATTGFSDLGAKLAMPLGTDLDLRAGASWQHAFGGIRSKATLAFAGGGTPFSATGTSLSRDAASPTLDLVWHPMPAFRLAAGYAGLFGARSSQNVGRITLAAGF